MKNVEGWREKIRESKIGVEKCVTFTEKRNDFITMECTKITKWYKMEGVYT